MAKPDPSKLQALHTELGKFVLTFADVESHLSTTARIVSNAPPHLLFAIVDTWRVDRGVTIIRQLLAATNYPIEIQDGLRAALARLAEINNLRNALLHGVTTAVPDPEFAKLIGKPADFDFGADFVATNAVSARNDDVIRNYPVSAEILIDAARDLNTIFEHLMLCEAAILDERIPSRTPRPGAKEQLAALKSHKWAWKPAQQSGGRKRSRSK